MALLQLLHLLQRQHLLLHRSRQRIPPPILPTPGHPQKTNVSNTSAIGVSLQAIIPTTATPAVIATLETENVQARRRLAT